MKLFFCQNFALDSTAQSSMRPSPSAATGQCPWPVTQILSCPEETSLPSTLVLVAAGVHFLLRVKVRWRSDPPQNCYLNVKNCQKRHFFQTICQKMTIFGFFGGNFLNSNGNFPEGQVFSKSPNSFGGKIITFNFFFFEKVRVAIFIFHTSRVTIWFWPRTSRTDWKIHKLYLSPEMSFLCIMCVTFAPNRINPGF